MIEFALTERNRIADDLFGGEDFYVKAYTNTISSTGTGGTEVTAAGYDQIDVVNNPTTFPAATTGSVSNAVKLPSTFLAITEDFTIVSLGFFRTSDDVFLARKVFDTPFDVYSGQSYGFPVNSITFTPTNA